MDMPVLMGCYGIGLGRLMGTIVEIYNDDRGIIWPESVAPFDVHLILLNESLRSTSGEIYESLQKAGVEVLYDERMGKSVGEKFADSDLMGIPYRIVVSEKSMEKGGVEFKKRSEEESSIIKKEDILNYVKKVQ